MPWWLPEAFPPGWAAGFYDRVIARLLASDYAKVAGELEAAVAPGDIVVDLGTGPAHLPVLLAQRRPDLRIIGIDLSERMLRPGIGMMRRHLAPKEQKDARLSLIAMDANRLGFRPGRIGTITSSRAFHLWKRPERVFDEIHRALAPGGRAWLYDNRADATNADLGILKGGLNRQGGFPPLWLARLMLRLHGLTDEGYRTAVQIAAARSRFLSARFTPRGLLMRIELEKR